MKIDRLVLLIMWISFSWHEQSEVPFRLNYVQKDKCRTVERKFTITQKKAVLCGMIVDCETQKPLRPGVLNINGSIFYTDSLGMFHKLVKPGRYLVRAGWPSYQFKTIKTQLNLKDSLNVVFYLKTDERPLESYRVD